MKPTSANGVRGHGECSHEFGVEAFVSGSFTDVARIAKELPFTADVKNWGDSVEDFLYRVVVGFQDAELQACLPTNSRVMSDYPNCCRMCPAVNDCYKSLDAGFFRKNEPEKIE